MTLIRTHIRTWNYLLILGSLLLVMTICALEVDGKTIVVAKDGTGDYSTIQEGVDASADGDTIEVHGGTFAETIAVSKSVHLVGNGSGETIIDGGEEGDVVTITADHVNMSGFGVSGSGDEEAGIKVEGNHTNITGVRCYGNSVGISISGSFNGVSYNECSNNSATGIFFLNADNGIIQGNDCPNNKNYGIYVLEGSEIRVSGNNCTLNTYGIYVRHSSNISLVENRCFENYVYGIYVSTTDHTDVSDNICNGSKRGIWISHGEYITLLKNSCRGNQEGIMLSNSNRNVIRKNICENNIDGMFLETSEYTDIMNNSIIRNTASGIHLTEDSSHNNLKSNNCSFNTERGMYLRSSSGFNVIENNTIMGNKIGIRFAQHASNNTVRNNNIFSNYDYGIHAENNINEVDAILNWWGKGTGPYHETENPDGKGDNITNLVIFEPWLLQRVNPKPVAIIVTVDPNPGVQEKAITFHADAQDDGYIVLYVWRSNKDGEFYNGTDSVFKYTKLSSGEHTVYLKVLDDNGAWSEEVSTTIEVKEADDQGVGMVLTSAIVLICLAAVGCWYYLTRIKGK